MSMGYPMLDFILLRRYSNVVLEFTKAFPNAFLLLKCAICGICRHLFGDPFSNTTPTMRDLVQSQMAAFHLPINIP